MPNLSLFTLIQPIKKVHWNKFNPIQPNWIKFNNSPEFNPVNPNSNHLSQFKPFIPIRPIYPNHPNSLQLTLVRPNLPYFTQTPPIHANSTLNWPNSTQFSCLSHKFNPLRPLSHINIFNILNPLSRVYKFCAIQSI